MRNSIIKKQAASKAKYSTGKKTPSVVDRKSVSAAGYAKGKKAPPVIDPKGTPYMKHY